jgi:hypothetical protein
MTVFPDATWPAEQLIQRTICIPAAEEAVDVVHVSTSRRVSG